MVTMHVCTTYHDPGKRNHGSIHVSGANHGYSIANFGYNSGFDGFLRTKLIPLRDHLVTITAKYSMFLDGNDIVLTSPPEDILATWEEMSGGKVVIGSELAVWPYKDLRGFLEERAFKKTQGLSPYISIDTGLILGKTKDIISILDTVIDSVPKYTLERPKSPVRIIEDDVGLFALNLNDGAIDVTIDYMCDIIVPIKSTMDHWFEIVDSKFHLLKTNRTPHIVHFNGHRRIDRSRMKVLSAPLMGVTKNKCKKRGL